MKSLGQVYGEYLGALEQASLLRAEAVVCQALVEGYDPGEIYLQVLGPGAQEIGRLWQSGALCLSQSYAAGIITHQVMDFMASRFDPPPLVASPPTLLLETMPGEPHDIGRRMASDIFRRGGWRVLGGEHGNGTSGLVDRALGNAPDLIALAITLSCNVPLVAATIRELRRVGIAVPIAVAGFPFDALPDLWRRVGADLYASDPRILLSTANNIVGGPASADFREPVAVA